MGHFSDRLFELPVPEGSDDQAVAGFIANCDRRFQIRLTADEFLVLEEWIPTGLCYRQDADGLRSEAIADFPELMRDPNGFAGSVTRLGIDSDLIVRELSGPDRPGARMKTLLQIEQAVLKSLENNVWYRPENPS